MTKFEYVTVPLLTHVTKQILDNWGSEGWELVHWLAFFSMKANNSLKY
jgi:hypothetical protein